MSNPNPSADMSEVISNYVHEYVENKLKHILYEEWFTGFKYRTDPDVMGRVLMLRDLCKDHDIDFNALMDDLFDDVPHDCVHIFMKEVCKYENR